MKDDKPRDLTAEEIEELRQDAKEGHEWFEKNYLRVLAEAEKCTEEEMAEALKKFQNKPNGGRKK